MNIFIILFYLTLFYIFVDFFKKNYKFSKNELPSPFGIALPIIGHIHHLIGKEPYIDIANASKKTENGILKLWNGDNLMVVVDNPLIIKQMYVNSANFIDRPTSNVFRIISRNYKDSGLSNGEQWKHLRGLYAPSFTKIKSKSHEDMLLKFIKYEIKSLKHHAKTNTLYDPFLVSNINSFGTKVISEIMFGKEFEENEIFTLIEPLNKLFGTLDKSILSESISILKPFFRGAYNECEKQVDKLYEMVEKIYDQHVNDLDKNDPKDLLDSMIIETNAQEKEHVICCCCDLLMGTKDTFNTIILWFFVLMSNNQHVQKKTYNEIVDVLSKTNRDYLCIEDIENLPYVDALIKEISRIHPAGPLSVPRVAINDTTINEYFIPKGSHIFQNTYGAVYNYMKESEEPSKIKPERWFENEKLKKAGKLNPIEDLSLISLPFSSGIRNCPGIGFAEIELMLLISNILYNCHLSSHNGKIINEKGNFGLTMKPNHFLIDIKLR